MSSCKLAMKIIILYFIAISLALGRSFHPPGVSNHPHGAKIPSYMMHLYQTLTGNKDHHRPENPILEESDTVQSITAKNFSVEDNRWSLTFDFSTISRNEELRMAELQVYLPPFTKSSNVTVDIYHINNGDKLFLGSVTRNVPSKENFSWTTFNVTKIIEQTLLWGKNITSHRGDDDAKSLDEYAHGHSRSIKKRHVSLNEINSDKAIIVLFTKHKPFSKPETPSFIRKLVVNTLKTIAFRRHMRIKSDIQLSTPSNTDPLEVEDYEPSDEKVDRLID